MLALTHLFSIVLLYILAVLGHPWVLYYAGACPGGFAWNMGRLLLLGILCPLANTILLLARSRGSAESE